jgi:sialate O-acetylesterase
MNTKIIFLSICLLCCVASSSRGVLRLPELLCDHMVLQQQADVSLWGWAYAGEKVIVETSWGVKTQAVADEQGAWSVKVKTPAAQPLSKGLHPEHITFTVPNENMVQIKDVLIGEVWLCSGQSNMEMIMRPGYPPGWCGWYGEAFWNQESKTPERMGLRLLDVVPSPARTPQDNCSSAIPFKVFQPVDANGLIPDIRRGWQPCTLESRPYFQAVPYYFGTTLQDKLDLPVGLVVSIVGGTGIECWMRIDALHTVATFENATLTALNPFARGPACLYNGMIAPLTPMTIRGTIWYQGESNVGRPHYAELFQTLIADWRSAFHNPDMPFYFVQIAPFHYGGGTNAAELRQAQTAALQLKNTGMALSIDVSDVTNIHPKDKRDIGQRLAWKALAKTYGHTEIVADGPTAESAVADGGELRITFRDRGGGLISRDAKPLTCFEVADEDGAFSPADAVLESDMVVVSSPKVPQPKSVRFGWGDADVPNLMSRDGLPVAQFQVAVTNH